MPKGACFRCGQIGHVKKYFLLLSNTGFVGQSSVQSSTSIQGFGRSVVRLVGSSRSMTSSRSRTQGV